MLEKEFKQIILPGEELDLKQIIPEDQITNIKLSEQFKIIPDKDFIVSSSIGGKLYNKQINEDFICFALNKPQRYIPQVDDLIIGQIKFKSGDNYIVDINSTNDSQLSIYNFPGATKRNYPQLQSGSLIFCKIQTIPKYLPIQLTCLSETSIKHFSTNQNEFGELKNGILCNSSCITNLNDMDKICQIAHQIIDKLEVSVGKNHRIWIDGKGKLAKETLIGIKGVIENYTSLHNMINKMESIKQALLAMK